MAQVVDLAAERPAVELQNRRYHPNVVSFVRSDGISEAFRYHDLTRLYLHPSYETLKVDFTTAVVVIHGRNLLPAWQGLRFRRAKLLRVGSKAGGIGRLRPYALAPVSAVRAVEAPTTDSRARAGLTGA